MTNLTAKVAEPLSVLDRPSGQGVARAMWGAVLLVAGGVAYYYLRPTAPKARFETATLDRGTLVSKVTSSGTVSALVTVQVGSQVSGRIKEILVDFNSTVKKGDLIARIDPAFYGAQVEQNRAQLLTAQSTVGKDRVTVKDATRTFGRQKELRAQDLNAQADLDTAETAMLAAQAQLEADEASVAVAKANLTQAQLNLSYTRIYAPISGTVISRAVDVGQTVATSFQAPTLFTIAQDLTHMQVDSNIAESDVGKLKPKMTASFTVDAFPSKRFEGTVRQIRNAANVLQNVVTYDAVLDVANPALELRPGMTANITLIAERRENVLRVPNAALRFKPPPDLLAGGKGRDHGKHAASGESAEIQPDSEGADLPGMRTVYLAKEESAQPVRLRIGASDGSFTEVEDSKLAAGDAVIVGLPAGASERAPKTRPPF